MRAPRRGMMPPDFTASRVFSVAGKDRSAILMGGHKSDLTLWYDKNAGRYVTSGYSVRVAPGPGYYGNRYYPAPRVGAFATAPWDDGYYAPGYYPSGYYPSYGSYGLVERQW